MFKRPLLCMVRCNINLSSPYFMSALPLAPEMHSHALCAGAAAHSGYTTVHIVEHMAPGGVETLVLDMIEGLPGRHVIFSLSGRPDALRAAWPRLAGDSASLEGFDRPPGINPGLIGRIAKRLRAVRPDAVVLHHIGPLIYGGLAARLAGIPVLVHVEHDAWHYESARRRLLARALFKLVRPRRVAVSDEIANRTETFFGGRRAAVVPPGVDMNHFRPRDRSAARARLCLSNDVAIVGTSGRLVPVKNQIALIDALAILRRQRLAASRSIEIVIVGEGPERAALEARAREHGLTSVVHLLGHRDDMADVLPSFDIYCLPSLNEGLPRAVLEAQAVGLPVVASAVGALADAVCPVSGTLVPPADVPTLAAALRARLEANIDPAVPRAFVADRYALTATLADFKRLMQYPDVPNVH